MLAAPYKCSTGQTKKSTLLRKVLMPSVATGMRRISVMFVDIRKLVKLAELFQMLTLGHVHATLTIDTW